MILIECNADEQLVKTLAQISKKNIIHCQGKSRVFNFLKKRSNYLAMVDEDVHGSKCPYESTLKLCCEQYSIKKFKDKNENTIIQIPENLEKWILKLCDKYKIDIRKFGLPDTYNELHSILYQKLNLFDNLLNYFLSEGINEIKYLQSILKQ